MATKKIEFILDVNSKPIDVAVDSTLNLKQQFRELTKELNKTQEGTVEFELLSAKLGNVKDSMETTTAKSKDLFGSLSMLPGPVGDFSSQVDSAVGTLKTFTSFSFKDLKFQLGQTLDDFKDIATNIGKATGITKIYTVLNNFLATSFVKLGIAETAAATGAKAFAAALTATGIGAIVVALGFLISALMEFATGTKAADEANEKLNQTLKEQERLLNVDMKALDNATKLAVARAKAAGKSEAEIYQIQKKAGEDRLKLLQEDDEKTFQALRELANNTVLTEEQKLEKQKELQEKYRKGGEAITQQIIDNELLRVNEEGRIAQIGRDQKDKDNQKKLEQNKEYLQKLEQDTKKGLEKLKELESNNRVEAVRDARAREDAQMAEDKKKEEEEIKGLQLKETKINEVVVTDEQLRQQLLDQVKEKYRLKAVTVQEKRDKEDIDKEKDLQEKLNAIQEAGEQASLDIMKEGAAKQIAQIEKDGKDKIAKYTEQVNELVKLNKLTQDKANELISGFTANVQTAVTTATDEVTKKDWLEKFDENLTTFFMDTEHAYTDIKDVITQAQEDLDARFKAGAISQTEYIQRTLALENELLSAQEKRVMTIQMLSQATAGLAQAMGEESAAGKILTKISQGLALASTGLALADAFAGLGKDLKKGFPTNIIAVSSTLLLMGTAITQFKQLFGKGPKDLTKGDTGSGSSGQNLGRNYAEGGLIGGKRHAQGGTLIEAEQGEAIMTRGAVTMFQPLLSMMNQMGGGTSFTSGAVGGARPDAPLLNNPSLSQSPTIMKTYVVSNELTTEAERQARLKDLSTL